MNIDERYCGEPAFDAARLRQLAAGLCDDNLPEIESHELETMLASSAAARSVFVRYMNIHAGVEWEVTARELVEAMVPALATGELRQTRQSRRRAWHWAAAAIAATVFIGSIAMLWRGNRLPVGDPKVAVDSAPKTRNVVADVTDSGAKAIWSVARRNDAASSQLRPGDIISVNEGQMQVTFESGAVVTLYAPAEMEVISPMKGRAIRGKFAANVAKGAEGFTIETPKATVVDLGTVFGVEVSDQGDTDVVVFKGAVDLHIESPEGDEPPATPHRLRSGEAMRIDRRGTASRIVSISSDRFNNRLDYHAPKVARPLLISAVSDNIERDAGAWNYYEIVHGGMQEDAKAFVDRDEHEWNGVDASGMPKFLVGGDYVKTFNNDKFGRDIEIFVTVEHPCKLYILLDDRIEPPDWLRRRFRDTGSDIGVDVGRFYRDVDNVFMDDRLPGAGPGASIDDFVSIWECDIATSEVVSLGATGATHRWVNMYGIVAVPLGRSPTLDD